MAAGRPVLRRYSHLRSEGQGRRRLREPRHRL